MKVTISLDDLITNTEIDMCEQGYEPKFIHYCIIKTLEDEIEDLKAEFKEKHGMSYDDFLNQPLDEDK